VIYDCDGVLIDSEVLGIHGERRALAEFGLEYEAELFTSRFLGMHDLTFHKALRQDYRDAYGKEAPDDFEKIIFESRRSEMAALTPINGALEALQAHPVIAIASSSEMQLLESNLKQVGLWDHAAPHVYSADLVEHGKPAPDIFLYAAKKLGVSPNKCLVVEDSVNGVKAGVAAGMTVWGFTGGGHCFEGNGERLYEAGAKWIAEDFDALINKL